MRARNLFWSKNSLCLGLAVNNNNNNNNTNIYKVRILSLLESGYETLPMSNATLTPRFSGPESRIRISNIIRIISNS